MLQAPGSSTLLHDSQRIVIQVFLLIHNGMTMEMPTPSPHTFTAITCGLAWVSWRCTLSQKRFPFTHLPTYAQATLGRVVFHEPNAVSSTSASVQAITAHLSSLLTDEWLGCEADWMVLLDCGDSVSHTIHVQPLMVGERNCGIAILHRCYT